MTQVKQKNTDDILKNIIYHISHDMRAPLRQTATLSSMLHEDYRDKLDEQAQRWLSLIENSSNRAEEMLKALSRYAKLCHDNIPFKQFDLNKTWHAVLSENDALIPHDANITAQALPAIHGIEQHWYILLSELLKNSLLFKQSYQTPKIKINCNLSEQGILTLEFHDNGIGVDEKVHTQIADIFRRLHPEDEYSGVGMGLAFCKRILTNCAGRIDFSKSDLGGLLVICTAETQNRSI